MTVALTSPPEQGQLVSVRSRQWVVNDVRPSTLPSTALKPNFTGPQHLLTLASVEDDGLGEELQVIWEIEPGAKVIEKVALPEPTGFDPPDKLDAFLDAVRWGAASTADVKNIQAPFRSGIEIEDYQLDPVVRAIQMPRVNLLIADDVGLGKTIEAGMVGLELIIRHRARRILIVCPSALQIQWKEQMRDKFGLDFRIVDSALMKELRRSRGIHVNPWSHFPRLITSIDFLKRERPLRLFREVLPGPDEPTYPRKFDLLIVDEAHNCAPSGRGKYATDSMRTQALRALVPHFEHKLFLTATPHNGYPESFTALLELLDNQRFARGTPPDRKQLEAVMVRRLKSELPKKWDGSPRFPKRELEPLEVAYTTEERAIHAALRKYSELRQARAEDNAEKFATEFVLKTLKKRLFSSPAAFAATLDRHEKSLYTAKRSRGESRPSFGILQREIDRIEEDYAQDDEYDEATTDALDTASRLFSEPTEQELALLKQMKEWAARASAQLDSKVKQLFRWLDDHLRPGKKWGSERVIIFTEYRATQNWLKMVLATEGFTGGDRLLTMYGGMDPKEREAVKAAFQTAPDKSPVRILLATDAASEGLDLQNHCSKLIHYEIPWNPNRMEQRNGRIDRHGQKANQVNVYHFVAQGYKDRERRNFTESISDLEADLEFLMRVARKIEIIREDLGKVGPVIAEQVEEAMLGRRSTLNTAKAEEDAEPVRKMLKFERDLAKHVKALLDQYHETQKELRLSSSNIQKVIQVALEVADKPLLIPTVLPDKRTAYAEVAEQHEILQPDLVLLDLSSGNARLLIQTYPLSQDLTKPVAGKTWKASPDTRMTELLHKTGVRLGLVTNGERWMLVDAPSGETTGYASWYATLWLEEPITLRAFRSLLGLHRFFGVAENETLPELLKKSAANQHDVTDQLGYQVRRAVEVLIQSLDRADQDHGRELLQRVSEAELYEAALTVMMRLVFLFCAEERGLFPLDNDVYCLYFAASTVGKQLREAADQFGEEVLERRLDAWPRLLAIFRAIYGGMYHDQLALLPYGGRLFDPDRFPFLEGRKPDTTWRDTEATPLPVNNRTVLHLLEALQLLQVKVPGGGPAEARRLSFRALDIEQIGHVYEGLLDHTARRAGEPHLGLAGTKNQEPEIPLAKLEVLREKGEQAIIKFCKEETGRSEKAIKKALEAQFDAQMVSRFRAACQGDEALWKRVEPFAGLVRLDSFDYPVVIPKGSVFVTEGTDRRSSGTHYTPRSLTEPIVQYTLEPLVYVGPAEGLSKDQWQLKLAKDLLDLKVCDMACGSGAFLVQACRYLSERLLEAWEQAEKHVQPGHQGSLFGKSRSPQPDTVRITPYGTPSAGGLYEQLVPVDQDERLIYARRIVAQRCLYGVDKNPLAVEMAKLSLWLLTLAKDKPFEFLDHSIRCGDSLVGIHELKQLENLTMSGEKQYAKAFLESLQSSVQKATELRRQLETTPANDVEGVKAQERLQQEAEALTAKLRAAADLLISDAFNNDDGGLLTVVAHFRDGSAESLQTQADKRLRGQETFHWPLEFPEVMVERGGFDAFVGNPPFVGGRRIRRTLTEDYLKWLTERAFAGSSGNADLCAFFFRRVSHLLRQLGCFGMLATNTIAQGDTHDVGLTSLMAEGFNIYRAVPSLKWPGGANLEVALLWLRHGQWPGVILLSERSVHSITASLVEAGAIVGKPYQLAENSGSSFQGSIVLGTGFVLTEEEASGLIERNPKNRDVLFRYLRGEDFTSSADQSPTRWVINFFDWPIEKAMDYPDCFRIIEERVKPERTRRKEGTNEFQLRKPLPQKWWIYADKRPALYKAIFGLERVLFHSFTSKYVVFAFVRNGYVYAGPHNVFALTEYRKFASLQSSLHNSWAWEHCSTMETRLRYANGDLYETFPFSRSQEHSDLSLESLGIKYHRLRETLMLRFGEGLTDHYNRFHAADETNADIQKLRHLHVEMDQAVAAAYGWTDLDLGHGFHQTKQGLRYTISEPARREVLARLLKLNHERYAEEVAKGLHEKKKGKKRAKATVKDDNSEKLFQ